MIEAANLRRPQMLHDGGAPALPPATKPGPDISGGPPLPAIAAAPPPRVRHNPPSDCDGRRSPQSLGKDLLANTIPMKEPIASPFRGSHGMPPIRSSSNKGNPKSAGSRKNQTHRPPIREADSQWNIRRPAGFLDALLELMDFLDPKPLVPVRSRPRSSPPPHSR